MADTILAASIQMEPLIGQPARNIAHSVALLEQAADRGATLAVLPELCNSGYVFESVEEARHLAEDAASGPAVQAWQEVAARRGLIVVAGLCERAGEALFNTAVAVSAAGLIGKFRKVHLWDQENRFFTPGDLRFPVVPAPWGRFAMLVCYDGWFPESYRACALAGADVICVPTNWVPMPEQPPERDVMANTLVMAGAHSNGVYVVAADRVGTERGQPFLGCSLIVAPTGFPIAGPASPDKEEILLAEIEPSRAARSRRLNRYNHLLDNRRLDQY